MKLILMGCEYAGKRTLGVEISKWWHKKTILNLLLRHR